jgi:HAMP domain-containing protein
MRIHCPELTADQIAEWMRAAAERPTNKLAAGRPSVERPLRHHHPGFDFKKAREALGRARTKTDVHTIKPLQRLRRNQGAVNEGLIDSFSALIAVNKQMAAEISALSSEMATLRQMVAEAQNSEQS